MPVSLRERHVEATRAALVRAARLLFGRRGYAATTTAAICRRAGVTEGALYHHFPTKQALFREVIEQVEREGVRDMAAAIAPTRDAWERIEAALDDFFCSLRDPARRQIVYVDGPAVLSYDGIRAIQERYAQRFTAELLTDALGPALRRRHDPAEVARVVNAAVMEAGIIASTRPDGGDAHERLKRVVLAFVHGLAADASGGGTVEGARRTR